MAQLKNSLKFRVLSLKFGVDDTVMPILVILGFDHYPPTYTDY